MESLVSRIENTALNDWVLGSAWVWPTLEILHFIGLSLLLGSLVIADLRLAGFVRQLSIDGMLRLLPVSLIGFLINLGTGVLFVVGDPGRYFANVGFRIKMLLVVMAGLNLLWFYWKISPAMRTWDAHGDTPALAKIIAFISIGIWTGVLLLGRLIPYIGTG